LKLKQTNHKVAMHATKQAEVNKVLDDENKQTKIGKWQ
jgi:hypothetical protein